MNRVNAMELETSTLSYEAEIFDTLKVHLKSTGGTIQ